jgi:putative transposase
MTGPTALQPGMYYHIYNRGINRENIFFEERNYHYFMDLYAKYVEPVAETFAYCLLKNHFHLLVKIKDEEEINLATETKTLRVFETLRVSSTNPSTAFSNLFNAYAKSINKAYGRTGSLFAHPFQRVMVTDDAQFTAVVRYIHQNPQKHGFVTDFRDWPYSSYGVLLAEKPTRLKRDAVLEWFGGRSGYTSIHAEWMKDGKEREFVDDD